jgi:signal transduction histidine kinase
MPIESAVASRAREQERRRLACDLHDECGQHLTALRLHLDVLRAHAAGCALTDQLDRALGIAAALDESLEAVARDLRPPPLDAGLGHAVATLARRWSARAGVAVDVRGAEAWNREIDDDVAIHLYRTVQEALHNVAKHARATQVVIRLGGAPAELSLTLVDDGVGFSGAAAVARRRAGGFGLISLRERATALHGRLEIASVSGRGTTVSLVVPLAAENVTGRSPALARPAYPPAPAGSAGSTRTPPTPARAGRAPRSVRASSG